MAAVCFRRREGARLAAALMAVAMLVGTSECVCSAGVVRVGAHGAGHGSMLRLRGGSAAAQMAQIRAERAKKFEEEKKKEASNQDSLDEGFEGAGKTWCYATGKVGPATVGTKKMDMPKGDARNFYLDDGATVLRNKRTGMVIELLDGSKGWFLFSTMEGAKVQQISTAGNILSVSRWYVEGMIDDVKANPLRSNFVKAAGIRAGNWKVWRLPPGRAWTIRPVRSFFHTDALEGSRPCDPLECLMHAIAHFFSPLLPSPHPLGRIFNPRWQKSPYLTDPLPSPAAARHGRSPHGAHKRLLAGVQRTPHGGGLLRH